MRILAIDPGPTSSAFVVFDAGRVRDSDHCTNECLLAMMCAPAFMETTDVTVIEQIESMGMAVGASVFETVFWSGRFAQVSEYRFDRVTRRAVKLHLCGSMRAKDQNIRQALIDRFGGDHAIGKKASPGPLYGISSHRWAALAVAVTYFDQQKGQHRHGKESSQEVKGRKAQSAQDRRYEDLERQIAETRPA